MFLGAIAAVLGLAAFVLWPLVSSGYITDDMWHSQVPMVLRARGVSVWHLIAEVTGYWMTNAGRFFPATIGPALLAPLVFEDRLAYKLFQLGAVLVNVILLIALVTVMTRSRSAGILAGALVVTTFQFRFFADGILSFSALQPRVVASVLGALLCLHRFMTTERRRWGVLAAALWAVGLLTYEVTYVLLPLVPVLAYATRASRKAKLTACVYPFVPTLVLGLYVAYLRSLVPEATPISYVTDLSLWRLVPTFLVQAFATVPLSYSLADDRYRTVPSWPATSFPLWADGLVALTVAALVVGAGRCLPAASWRVVLTLAVSGGVLWLVPALVVGQTRYWQDALQLGFGYISVYSQSYGLAILATSAALAVARARLPWRLGARRVASLAGLVLLAGVVFWCIHATADSNRRVVAALNTVHLHPRELFAESVRHGLVQSVPTGSTILALPHAAWFNKCFISWFGGPDVEVLGMGPPFAPQELYGCSSPLEGRQATASFAYALSHAGNADGSVGWVRLAHNSAGMSPMMTSAAVPSRDVLLFVKHPELGRQLAGSDVSSGCRWLREPSAAPEAAEPRTFSSEVSVAAEGQGWAILRVLPTEGYCHGDTPVIRRPR